MGDPYKQSAAVAERIALDYSGPAHSRSRGGIGRGDTRGHLRRPEARGGSPSVRGTVQVTVSHGHGEAGGDPRLLYYNLLVHGGGRVARAGVWRVGQFAQAALPASSPTTRHDTHRWCLFAQVYAHKSVKVAARRVSACMMELISGT